jgi:ATP-dependent Lon protease
VTLLLLRKKAEKCIAGIAENLWQKIFELILPEPNRGSFDELPDYLKEGITVHFAKRFADVAKVLF